MLARARISSALLLLCAVASASCKRANDAPPSPEVTALRDAVLASSEAYRTVESLTDEIGPRLSGSPGGQAAIAWGTRALERAGLTHVHSEPCKVPHWVRGRESAAIVTPSPQPLVVAALGGSVGTPPDGLDAEVVEAPSIDALDAMDPKLVAGRIAVVHAIMPRTHDGKGYGATVGVRGRAASHAAKLGAVAVLIRSIGTDQDRTPHTGAMRYDPAAPKIPAAALSSPDADALHRLLASGTSVRIHLELGAETLPDADGANVVGDVEGSEAKDQIVLVGAHLDSWDLGKGALDDGAGCAIVIEAGRQIAKLARKPRRTVRVVLFANEENGLRGATAYATAHAAEIGAHVLAMEADLGGAAVYGARFLGDPAARPQFLDLVRGLEPLGIKAGDEDAHGGADISPLLEAGVPVIDLRQDATAYFDVHHSANDTIERVAKGEIDRAAAAFAVAAFEAADARGDFGRVPEAKRKPDG